MSRLIHMEVALDVDSVDLGELPFYVSGGTRAWLVGLVVKLVSDTLRGSGLREFHRDDTVQARQLAQLDGVVQ